MTEQPCHRPDDHEPATNGAAADTLLMDALLADETVFDRLVDAFPAFRSFARVLMREDTATRLSLADIASMAGVPLGQVLAVARGRSAGAEADGGAGPTPLPDERPRWLEDPAGGEQRRFDARPLLEAGHEPLSDILTFVETAPPRNVLVLDATFHLVPLRRLLARRGYVTFAESMAADHWRVYARKEH